MAPPSPNQVVWRGRIEALIRLAEPALNLVLKGGDRLSRLVEPEDLDWTPPRAVSSAPRRPRVEAGPTTQTGD